MPNSKMSPLRAFDIVALVVENNDFDLTLSIVQENGEEIETVSTEGTSFNATDLKEALEVLLWDWKRHGDFECEIEDACSEFRLKEKLFYDTLGGRDATP